MTWREQIRPGDDEHAGEASFRGVWFKVAVGKIETGRRNVVHVYPDRDEPYPEDMGRSAKRWRVEGFVIGDDYLDQRDALIEAIEQPGPGELVHPRYGVLNVSVDGHVSVDESTREGGLARFSITFVDAGANVFPGSEDDTVQEVDDAGDEVEDAAEDDILDLGALDFSGPASILSDAIATVQDTIASVLDMVNQVTSLGGLTDLASQIGDFAGDLVGQLLEPLNFVDGIRSMFDSVVDSVDRPRSALEQLQTIYDDHAPPVNTARPGSVAARIVQNQTQINALVRANSLAVQARVLAIAISGGIDAPNVAASSRPAAGKTVMVGGISIGGTAGTGTTGAGSTGSSSSTAGRSPAAVRARRAQALAAAALQQRREAPVATSAQAIALRDTVLDRIDIELETTEPSPAKAAALQRLRAAVARDVSVRAELLRERSTFTPAAVLPALLIAHRVYVDATRVDELLARNALRNPNFVPAAPLEVLQ